MYLLDTNVISELRRARSNKADKHVVAWASSVPADSMYISAITVLELELGVLQIEHRDSKQGKLLRHWLDEQVLNHSSRRSCGDQMCEIALPRPKVRKRCINCSNGTCARTNFSHQKPIGF